MGLQPKSKVIDLTGQLFGDLRVTSLDHIKETNSGNKVTVWSCYCIKCGKRLTMERQRLQRCPSTKLCGRHP
jgi:hypothetical protein